ncbi:unnamed protein product [Aureobasidium pullulans]|nr:unnamed protein product [Aureobasidium pullulans]
MSQLARGLSLAGAIRCLRTRSRRNSRGNCPILRTHPAFESRYAATRAKTFSYKGHFLPPTSNSQHHAATRARTVSSCRDSACELHHVATCEVSPPKAHHAANRVGLAGNCSYSSNHCSLPPNQPATYVTLKLRTQAASLDWSQILSSNTHPSTTRVKATVRGIPSPDSTFSG